LKVTGENQITPDGERPLVVHELAANRIRSYALPGGAVLGRPHWTSPWSRRARASSLAPEVAALKSRSFE
jgi:hypothetical protein